MRRVLRFGWIELLALAACATPDAVPVPHGGSARPPPAAEELIFASLPRAARVPGDARLFGGLHVAQREVGDRAADFATPHRLRPYCAFGHGLALGIGAVPLPGIRLDNLLDPGQLGRHRYDAALLGLANGLTTRSYRLSAMASSTPGGVASSTSPTCGSTRTGPST